MKTLTGLAALILATPALAHDGAHMHPHGYESAIALALAIGTITALAVSRRR